MKTKALSHPYLYLIPSLVLLFSTIMSAQTQTVQTSEALTPETNLVASSSNTSSSLSDLPDAPSAQAAQSQAPPVPPARPEDHTQINPIALLSPRLISGQPMTAHDKFEIYIHKAYSPAAVIYPMFGSALKLAKPNQDYPPEWQDGMGAFGRNYGDTIARRTSKTTAEFATQVLFHEDPRYARSASKNVAVRLGHAIGWTLVDKSDSGHSMLAVSTFTGAAAGSYVGMAYLPDGFNDAHHAQTRMLTSIGGKAISNALIEFEPQWGPIARKIHIPRLLPEWWTSDHKK